WARHHGTATSAPAVAPRAARNQEGPSVAQAAAHAVAVPAARIAAGLERTRSTASAPAVTTRPRATPRLACRIPHRMVAAAATPRPIHSGTNWGRMDGPLTFSNRPLAPRVWVWVVTVYSSDSPGPAGLFRPGPGV